MKKVFKILGIIIAIFILSLFLIPIIFQGRIESLVRKEINKQINAKVDFSEVDLSLIKQFPKFSIDIYNLSISGIDKFKGDTLANINQISTTVDFADVISSSTITVNEVAIINPSILLKINKEGLANWDIAPASDTPEKETKEATGEISIDLEKIEITNGTVQYIDEEGLMIFSTTPLNFLLSGQMKGANTTLDVSATASNIEFEMEDSKYVQDVALNLKGKLAANFNDMSFSFLENEILINQLPLALEGKFILGDSDYDMDINFKAKSTDFEKILGFVPEDYQKYIKDVKTTGQLRFDGFVKGKYSEETFPAIKINLVAENGTLQYPELPEKVENIGVEMTMGKPQGDMDLFEVNISKFHAEAAGNPIDGRLKLNNLMSDMGIDMKADTKIDFQSLKKAIPMENIQLKGKMEADFELSGKMSALEKEEYEKFRTSGVASLQNFQFESKDLPLPFSISAAEMSMNPKSISMTRFNGKFGKTDFGMKGKLTNYLEYFLKDGTLKGDLTLYSNLIDVNELMAAMPEEADSLSQTEEEPMEAILIPEKLNINVNARVNNIIYSKMPITNTVGKLKIIEQKAILENLSMNLLEGSIAMNGTYNTILKKQPKYNMAVSMKQIDLPSAHRSLATARQFLSISKNSTGKFSVKMKLAGALTENMDLVVPSINGGGNFSSHNVRIEGAKVIDELAKALKNDKLRRLKVDDFDAKFKIIKGELIVEPFTTKLAEQKTVVQGRQTPDLKINYTMDMNVSRKDLGGEFNDLFNFIPGSENIEYLDLTIKITGSIDKPVVKPDFTKAREQIKDELKKKSKEEIDKAVKDVKKEIEKGLKRLFR